jgi:tetratricopeptide (TPR) repeat protein
MDPTDETQAYKAAENPPETVEHSSQESAANDSGSATTDYQPVAPATAPGQAFGQRAETGAPLGGETQAYETQPIEPSLTAPGWKPPDARPGATAVEAGSMVGRGRYLLKNFHAKGGMGEIWLAEDCDIGREVALKRMRSGHDHQKPRFTLEAQITGQLEHPGVVPVHEVGIGEDGQPYYVMKFVRGHTLEKEIKEYHASTTDREVRLLRLLQCFVHLCHTIAYAHSRGVLHRDIKPDNVMLGPYGETLVLDWGIAKVMGQPESAESTGSVPVRYSGETELTRAGTIQGTPSYMAPEVAQGLNAEVDHRSDIYLLGSTLYQMLTGKRPRKAANVSELLKMARSTPPPAPRKLDATIPRALEAICLKAMAHAKEGRYESATVLADDVQRYLAGEPVSAYAEPFLDRAWRWAWKHRRGLGTAAAALLAVGLILFSVVKVRDAEKRRIAAEQESTLLKNQGQARADLKEFRRQSDEAHFYLAALKPVEEQAPFLDPQKGQAAVSAALKTIEPWGAALENLPLSEEEQAAGKKQLYDLLLLSVQARTQDSGLSESSPKALDFLERASKLGPPSQGYYRLRAMCLQGADERAEDKQATLSSQDHFLLGEQLRLQANQQTDLQEKPKGLQAKRELLLKSLTEYQEALKLEPEHYWAHFRVGECYLSLGQSAEAVEAFSTCIALRPDSPWGYSARAMARASLRRFEQAESDLKRAIGLSPEMRQFRLNRGVVYMLQEKYDAALTEFSAAAEPPKETRLVEGLYDRGVLNFARANYAEVLKDFDQVVAERPSFLPVRLLRARIHFAQGEDGKGIEELNAFLARGRSFNEQSKEAYAQRGRVLRLLVPDLPPAARKSKLLLAAKELQQAAKLGARSESVFDDLGAVLQSLGKLEDAVTAYSMGLELGPANVKLLVKRGWVHADLRRFDKARDDFLSAIKIQPDHAEAHSGLGYAQACRKAETEALRQANLAVLGGAGDYLILHNVACIYGELAQSQSGRAREYENLALDQLQRAVELWKRDRSGPDEIKLMQNEPAFKSLSARPEFAKLLRAGG